MVAGLESISEGELLIDGKRVNDIPAKDRDIAMVFQSYALYPHMTVLDNLAFGLRRRDFAAAEIERRVREVASTLGLSDFLKRKPHALSGGQRQRVALGRAIVRDPKVFLFDEPLSNLDAALRVGMRGELIKLHHRLGATMIYVTHDQVEAMTMGDRICIMNGGKVAQIGAPLEVYARPADMFVASFLGSPPTNLIPGRFNAEALHVGEARLRSCKNDFYGKRRLRHPPGRHPHRRRRARRSRRGAGGGAARRRDAAARAPRRRCERRDGARPAHRARRGWRARAARVRPGRGASIRPDFPTTDLTWPPIPPY